MHEIVRSDALSILDDEADLTAEQRRAMYLQALARLMEKSTGFVGPLRALQLFFVYEKLPGKFSGEMYGQLFVYGTTIEPSMQEDWQKYGVGSSGRLER